MVQSTEIKGLLPEDHMVPAAQVLAWEGCSLPRFPLFPSSPFPVCQEQLYTGTVTLPFPGSSWQHLGTGTFSSAVILANQSINQSISVLK